MQSGVMGPFSDGLESHSALLHALHFPVCAPLCHKGAGLVDCNGRDYAKPLGLHISFTPYALCEEN